MDSQPDTSSSAQARLCPVTGLPMTCRQEWTNTRFDDTFEVTTSLIGTHILLSQPQGYVTLAGIRKGVALQDAILDELEVEPRSYIQIEDWTHLEGAALDARRFFADYLMQRASLRAMVFCNTSPLFRVSIKLARRLRRLRFKVFIVNTLVDALEQAQQVLATTSSQPEDSSLNLSGVHTNLIRTQPEQCPVSGLSVTTRPAWTDIDCGNGYSVTFKLIGDRILHSYSEGYAGRAGMARLMEERAKVIAEVFPDDEQFFELRDFSGISKLVSRESRDQFIKGLRPFQERLIGFIGYGAPLVTKLAIRVGRSLYQAPFPMYAVDDYPTAIREATAALTSWGIKEQASRPERASRADWILQSDGLTVRFERIGRFALHTIVSGVFAEHHVAPIIEMNTRVIHEAGLAGRPYTFIVGIDRVNLPTLKTQKLYLEQLSQWYRRYPFTLFAFYGAPRALRSAIYLVSHFAPFQVRLVKDFSEAVHLSQESLGAEIATEQPPPLVPEHGEHEQLQDWVDELLHFIAEINWDTEGMGEPNEPPSPSHPLSPVFDAIRLIKADLDHVISQQVASGEQLEKEKSYLEHLFSSAPDAIVMSDQDHNVMRVNTAFTKMFGYLPEEVIGSRIGELIIPPALRAEAASLIREVELHGKTVEVESRLSRKDGSELAVSLSLAPIVVARKQVGQYAIIRDITERKQAESRILKAKEEWERTFDSIPDAVSIQTPDMRIVRMNQAAAEITGMSKLSATSHPCYQVFRSRASVCAGCPIPRTLEEGRPHHATVEYAEAGKVYQVSASPIFDDQGHLTGIVHSARDITQRSKLEHQLQQAQKMEAIGTLASGIAHDFNNILSPIIGYTEITLDYDLNDPGAVQTNLQEVLKAANRAKDLVRQILAFSRQSKSSEQLIKIQPVIKESLKLLRPSIPSTIAIDAQIDETCGYVLADPTQIYQVIMNLCTNAFQSMRGKKGVLSVRLDEVEVDEESAGALSTLRPGRYVRLSVADTGHGIDQEIVPRIFDPYFTTKKVGEGTGMGLAVVHGIVKSCRGEIAVTSELGKGTTFDIYLPRTEEDTFSGAMALEDAVIGGNERILVVDDERPIVHVLEGILTRLGYQVSACLSSIEALRLFEAEPHGFDAVITDHTMPGMTGIELASRLMALNPDVPIILCTGFNDSGIEDKASEMGIKEYIIKPVEQNEIGHTLRRILDQQTQS